jgi:hypothetical protein
MNALMTKHPDALDLAPLMLVAHAIVGMVMLASYMVGA